MFIKSDKVQLRTAFKTDAFKKNPPAVGVSVNPDTRDFCLLVTCKDTRQRVRVKKLIEAMKLVSDVQYKVVVKTKK